MAMHGPFHGMERRLERHRGGDRQPRLIAGSDDRIALRGNVD